MNAKIIFFKDKRIEQENSIKIKEIIKNYLNFIFMDYIQENMTPENNKDIEELMSMFSGENEDLINLQNALGSILNGENQITDNDEEENISKKVENILDEINEENDYFIGKKSTPLSKDLFNDDSI